MWDIHDTINSINLSEVVTRKEIGQRTQVRCGRLGDIRNIGKNMPSMIMASMEWSKALFWCQTTPNTHSTDEVILRRLSFSRCFILAVSKSKK